MAYRAFLKAAGKRKCGDLLRLTGYNILVSRAILFFCLDSGPEGRKALDDLRKQYGSPKSGKRGLFG